MKIASLIWHTDSFLGSFSLLFLLLLLLPLFFPLSAPCSLPPASANACWVIKIFSGKQELYLVLIASLLLESTYKTPFLSCKDLMHLGLNWGGVGLSSIFLLPTRLNWDLKGQKERITTRDSPQHQILFMSLSTQKCVELGFMHPGCRCYRCCFGSL